MVTSDYVYGHNNFLHMAAEIGILDCSFFLWFLYALFARKLYDPSGERLPKITLLGFIVSIVSFLVNGLTESSSILFANRNSILVLRWLLPRFCKIYAPFFRKQSLASKSHKI